MEVEENKEKEKEESGEKWDLYHFSQTFIKIALKNQNG